MNPPDPWDLRHLVSGQAKIDVTNLAINTRDKLYYFGEKIPSGKALGRVVRPRAYMIYFRDNNGGTCG